VKEASIGFGAIFRNDKGQLLAATSNKLEICVDLFIIILPWDLEADTDDLLLALNAQYH